MDIQGFRVTPEAAAIALLEYKTHRNTYDKRDWEIERIYRQIAKGRTVISAFDAIRAAGIDEIGRPKLALMRADQEKVICDYWYEDRIIFINTNRSRAQGWYFEIPWLNRARRQFANAQAILPRIPPQHRPPADQLDKYHLLWEAHWTDIPRDPYLLKRIGKDAWVVLAAWDLTDVELAVLKAHRSAQ